MDDDVFEVGGNRLTLLPDGAARLDALIAMIDGAGKTLRILFYIYDDDAAGRRVRAALEAAAARGVTVWLIVDGFGSAADDAFFAPLEAAGASVCRFIPRIGRRYLLRNHQKLVLADGTRAIVGGFNVADDYFGTAKEQAWRDLGLRVEGPAAGRLTGYFDALQRWTGTRGAPIREVRRALTRWSETEGAVRWLLGGPTRRLSPWARAVKQDMAGAGALDIIAAYFAPNPAMLRRIESVPAGGGRARVVTAGKTDNPATIGAARHCYRRLLRRGVEVYEYQPTKLHTKLVVIDDVVHIGSANLDVRSLYINLEIMLRIEDAAFAAHCRGYFEGEAADSDRITRAGHRARSSLVNRLRWGVQYFLVAVMDYNVSRRLNFGLDGR